MEKSKKKKSFLQNDFVKNLGIYTILFGILISFMLFIFSHLGKSFLLEGDGVKIHISNLAYFRELLVNFIRTGKFSTFTWYIGNGFDIFSNFAYFIFGDFFSYLAVLGRTKDIGFMYNLITIIRIYFVGVSFLCYSKYRKMNRTPSLIGALMYTFSFYMLHASIKHTYFTDAVILFPLLMMGIEKMIKEDKCVFYTLIIAISFIVSFYFSYMMAVVIAIYGTILAIYHYKSFGAKKVISVLLKTLLYSIIGIMIAGFILIPTGVSYITSQRVNGNIVYSYPIAYYRHLFVSLINLKSAGFWMILGTQSILFIALPTFILRKRKKNVPLLLLLFVLLFPILSAAVASAFAGFNFPNNRWAFVYSFIFAFIVTMFFNEEHSLNKKDITIISIIMIVFFAVNVFFEMSLNIYAELVLGMIVLWILLINSRTYLQKKLKKINLYNVCLVAMVCVEIVASMKYLYGVEGHSYASNYTDSNSLQELTDTVGQTIPDFNQALNYIKEKDTSFYKVGRFPYYIMNVPLLKHFNTIGYYYSIVPTVYGDISSDLKNSQYHINGGVGEFDYRTKINTLLGTKYLIKCAPGIVPYGYSKVKDYKGESTIYKNNYSLPFGVLYDSYITEKEYNKLSFMEKESSLLKTAVLKQDKITDDLNHAEYDYNDSIKEVDYKIIDKKNVLKSSNRIVVEDKSANSFQLELGDIKNSEIYIEFKNLVHKPFTKEQMIQLHLNEELNSYQKAQIEHAYKWYEEDTSYTLKVGFYKLLKQYSMYNKNASPYYLDTKDFAFNLGYHKDASGKITVALDGLGTYTFDSIKVYTVSMDHYEEDVKKLKQSNFEVTDYDNGYLKGTVNAKKSGILQFQTMYNKGWNVYVDGKKVDVFKCNKYFLGINISKGKHEIYMEYHVPYLKEGFVVTIIGIIAFIGLIFINKRRSTE